MKATFSNVPEKESFPAI